MLFVSSVSQVCAACVPRLLATFLIHITQALQLHNANAQGHLFLLPQDLLISSSDLKSNPLYPSEGDTVKNKDKLTVCSN